MSKDTKALGLFFLLAYLFAWIAWLPLVLGVHGLKLVPWDVPIEWIIPGTFAPTLAALAVQRGVYHNWRAARLWSGWSRLGLGLVLGCGAIFLTFAVLVGGAMAEGGLRALDWSAYAALPSGFVMALWAGPLGEEAGWRGFALPRLQGFAGPVAASLILAVFWTCWHLPLFLLDNWTSSTLLQYGLILSMLSIVMTFGYNLSGGNLWVVIAMHAMFNAVPQYFGAAFGNGAVRAWPPMEYAIAAGFAATALVLILATRGRLGRATPRQ